MLLDVAPDVELTCFTTLGAALDGWPVDADCALLDLGLPDAMGLSALERLRTRIPDVPVVVLTGHTDEATGPQALAAGAQDFLVKGQVDGRGLERSLRYAVERGRVTAFERELVAAEVRAEENTRLQRGLLPSPLIDAAGLGVGLAFFYRPGSERDLLGGDFYDVVQTETGVHLLIGDVCGHGLDEAALGVALRIAWRALVLAGLGTAEVVRGVEQVLLAERDNDERYATVAMLSLDPGLTRAEVVLCGHPRPMLVRGREVVPLVVDPLPMLTMLEDSPIVPVTVELGPEWALLLYTDGLVEGRSSPGSSDRLGEERLADNLRRLVEAGTAQIEAPPLLLAESERCQGGALTDDVAILLIGSLGGWC